MTPNAQRSRSCITAVAAAGVLLTVLVVSIGLHKPSQAVVLAGAKRHAAAFGRLRGIGGEACSLEFVAYEPSEWELRWRDQVEELQHRACDQMLKDRDLVDAWMTPMNESFRAGVAPAKLPAMKDDEVFSHFRHRDTCTGAEVLTPMEPLVGTLRHPAVNSECGRPDRPDFTVTMHDPPRTVQRCRSKRANCTDPFGPAHIENKGYMVIQPLPAEDIQLLYPGRKVLFDIGTGRYKSGSLPWFMNIFEAKGIVFDEIYGWEVRAVKPEAYWKEFPADISYKMHFRNVPCDVNPYSPRNPLNIIRKIYKPGDFIALKLDIDTESIEQALMAQLDAKTAGMIAEFFFEQHYDIPEMRKYFGRLNTTLPQVLDMFHRFRSQGLRLHYWP